MNDSSGNNRMCKSITAGLVLLSLAMTGWPRVFERKGAPAHFTDITDSAGIRFQHIAAPENKYIVESMSGGVALLDYDNDGYLDSYFTNALTVATANNRRGSKSALYHNNGDGAFSDVTDRSGLGYPGWAMGVVAPDFDGDGFQ